MPPAYSAVKIKGRKAYELARKGKKVDLKPRRIKIYNIEVIDYEWPKLTLKINCGSATYIRSLARDIGRELKTGAYLTELRRTRVGNFKVENAVKVLDIKA